MQADLRRAISAVGAGADPEAPLPAAAAGCGWAGVVAGLLVVEVHPVAQAQLQVQDDD